MAGRPIKQGVDYFPLSVSLFSDVKIRKVSRSCGPNSVSVLICLLCNIYRENGYYILWDEDLPFFIADEVGVSEGCVKEIILKAIQVGFFDVEKYSAYGILTSYGIQKRFFEITKRRNETEIKQEYLINADNNSINVCNNSINACNNGQRKVKERKENITPSPPKRGSSKTKKKKTDGLNSKARLAFEEHYRQVFSSDYYWTAKDAGAMSKLLQKLRFQREQKQLDVSDDSIIYSLRYLLSSINEGWIFENFSVTNINSKFNEIVSQIKTAHNGNSRSSYSSKQEVNAYALSLLQQHKRELEEGMANEMERPF